MSAEPERELQMSEQPAPYRPNPTLKRFESGFEKLIFNSRWLMAPFYFGLVVSLAVLLLKFCMLLWEFIIHAPGSKESDIILGVLSLIDVSLSGNLILIVVFSGYENFVSKIDPRGHPDWPDWMTTTSAIWQGGKFSKWPGRCKFRRRLRAYHRPFCSV